VQADTLHTPKTVQQNQCDKGPVTLMTTVSANATATVLLLPAAAVYSAAEADTSAHSSCGDEGIKV
jgi:hypothetical protein